jgi:hypothetical protein
MTPSRPLSLLIDSLRQLAGSGRLALICGSRKLLSGLVAAVKVLRSLPGRALGSREQGPSQVT